MTRLTQNQIKSVLRDCFNAGTEVVYQGLKRREADDYRKEVVEAAYNAIKGSVSLQESSEG